MKTGLLASVSMLIALLLGAPAASRATTIYTIPYEFTITFNSTGIASIDLPAIANPLYLQDLGDFPIDIDYAGSFEAKNVSLLNSWTQDVYLEDHYTLAFPIRLALANVPGPVAQASGTPVLTHSFNFATGPVQIPDGDTYLLGDASGTVQVTTIQESTLRTLLETKQYLTYVVPVFSSTNALIQPLGVSLINPVGGTIEATGTLTITVVPEPSSIALVGLGIAATCALAICRRRCCV